MNFNILMMMIFVFIFSITASVLKESFFWFLTIFAFLYWGWLYIVDKKNENNALHAEGEKDDRN